MRLIALTGGIGAGKSTVAAMLCERGASLVDADAMSREVVDPTSAAGRELLSRVSELLGAEVIRADGTLDRQAAARAIFEDDRLRESYNAIIHPALRSATVAALAAMRAAGATVVVHEIPLLTARTGQLPWTYDLVVTVEASPATRAQRLVEVRGYTLEHAAARIAAQGAQADRIAIADVVIGTDSDLGDTRSAVDAVWARIASL
jgi:dephospho-CoA kinase